MSHITVRNLQFIISSAGYQCQHVLASSYADQHKNCLYWIGALISWCCRAVKALDFEDRSVVFDAIVPKGRYRSAIILLLAQFHNIG
jgi:predicted membrane protein